VIAFSIIIPVYNAASFLGRCIESCINQSYSNIEIICIDDGSTDNSREILLSYHNRDKRVLCFFNRQNESQYMARRTGIEHAKGDYLLFLDSDDTLTDDACALLEKKIEKEPVDVVQFGYREIPSNRAVFSPFYKTSTERIAAYLTKENRYSPEVWTKAYSRAIITKAYDSMQIFYASGAEDVYTSIVLAYHAKSFSFFKKALVNYSVNTGWSTRRVFSIDTYRAWLKSYQTVIQNTKQFIAANVPEFIPRCLDMEVYFLKDFIFCRMASQLSLETKHEVFDLFPDFFSKDACNVFYDELLWKYNEYEKYLDYSVSCRSKIKKLLKFVLRCFGSFFCL
jgi:glycosyltransferase involved in cell wall biosynthesis